ncbi:MAG: AEC family transporter [Hyphomicrobiaceae bacterium]|nr:AEC family transporter [Hyphomicrobiaceae bacterium]
MLAILTIVTPVFGIMLAGWLTERWRYLPEGSAKVIAQFCFNVSMPAFLFRAMQGIGDVPAAPWRFVAAFFGGIALVWIASALLARFVLRRSAADGAAISMGSCFGNGVMLGVPLALSAFGPDAAAPIGILVSLDSLILWIIATLHIEWASRRERTVPFLAALGGVVADLLRNPVVMGVVVGTLWRVGGLGVPELLDRFLALLGQAAVPSGLFALGMSLATYRIAGQLPTLTVIFAMKMLLLPAVVYVLSGPVLGLPPVWVAVAVLFAAMPVGANAFLFAAKYDRAVGSVSAAIAVSTVAAVGTASAVLYLMRPA